MDITVVSSRVEALKEALQGTLAQRIPEDVSFCYYSDIKSLDEKGLCAEIALGAPDVLAPLLEHMPNLRWLQSTWAGVTPFFEVPRRDYVLTGVKDIFGASMSEYALGWVLAIERSVLAHANARQWNFRIDRGLSELRVGVAGVGSIGTAVAAAFSDFVKEVRGLNSNGRLVEGCSACFATVNRQEFAQALDVLIMILPDTPATDGLVDAHMLGKLAPGAIVINVGRANALDLPAALNALGSGQLRALVLDVLDKEPLADDDPLWSTAGVYITSHTAAPTPMESIAGVFLDNLQRYRKGEALDGVIDFERGY
ncbi:NAD(P)-dependent oxidoreductase [Congregibacter variabilis]|uniref:NAD(P)-dependent oxidoreductase n=1 Tax=Congregibacter variabilis TaxID=3081200 RepID=A0ABZ0I6V3_9GAMM|nr:NAD(P)-dependent oxidoreductase [Congregibacter sp. IMCC43200]